MIFNKRRLYTALLSLFLVMTFLPSTANASAELDAMGNDVYDAYILFCTAILTPLLSLRFAGFGLQLLVAPLDGSASIGRIKKEILYVSLAYFVILFLPVIMSWAEDLLSGSGWTPEHMAPATAYRGGMSIG